MRAAVAGFFRRPARPGLGPLTMAALSGALVAAGQAPWSLWYLALPALSAAILIVITAPRGAVRVWLGWAAGLGYFAASLFWIVEPFLVDADQYGWMAPFALVFMSAGMALFWALAGLAANLGTGRASAALGFAAGLVAADLLRSYVFTGFPWALTGHIWIGTPVAQAAALIGPIGLSALACLAAAAPHLGRGNASRLLATALAAAGLIAVWQGGAARLAMLIPDRAPPVHIRLIQPNAAQSLKWDADLWRMFLNRQMVQTALPADPPLDLIVWPETAIPFLLDDAGAFLREMAVASGGVPIATGIQRAEGRRYFNSLVVVGGAGNPIALYDKWHLVPFGEYIPLGDLAASFGITAFAARNGAGYSAGPGARLIDLGTLGRVLPLICYEAVFPQDLRAAGGRADWILQITNDGWFGTVSGPYQHLAQARLRAIEQGLPLLRAANTGITAVIDARGEVLRSLALNTEGVIDAALPPSLPATIYSRTGDSPALAILSVVLAALFLRRRRKAH
ncbi:MAG: apolipoprotein N-acyltransferase [Rhodobacteraceae bacterium]|nr:apolipoprotein N-acyltransferase [Paracoccaceae bacterium]